MSYFNRFPVLGVNFQFDTNDRYFAVIKDIALNVRIRKELVASIKLYDEYDIEDGDTFEIISEKLYGRPYYHWILMLLNDRYNYLVDFPCNSNDLREFVYNKYKLNSFEDYNTVMHRTHRLHGVEHYETPDGLVVSKDTPNANPVTNYEYEEKINESKRRIKVVSKNTVVKLTTELDSLIK